MRYHLTPITVAIKKKKANKCWPGCRKIGTFVHCWWECKMMQPLWKTLWWFTKKLNIELLFDPAIPLQGIYTKVLIAGT